MTTTRVPTTPAKTARSLVPPAWAAAVDTPRPRRLAYRTSVTSNRRVILRPAGLHKNLLQTAPHALALLEFAPNGLVHLETARKCLMRPKQARSVAMHRMHATFLPSAMLAAVFTPTHRPSVLTLIPQVSMEPHAGKAGKRAGKRNALMASASLPTPPDWCAT